MASNRKHDLTVEAATERKLDGRAVLVEDAGVVVNIAHGRVTIFKEWADGKRQLCAQWTLDELKEANAPVHRASPRLERASRPATKRTAPALRGVTEDRRRLAGKVG